MLCSSDLSRMSWRTHIIGTLDGAFPHGVMGAGWRLKMFDVPQTHGISYLIRSMGLVDLRTFIINHQPNVGKCDVDGSYGYSKCTRFSKICTLPATNMFVPANKPPSRKEKIIFQLQPSIFQVGFYSFR